MFANSNISYLQAQLVAARALPPNTHAVCEQQLAQALRRARTSYLETWQAVVYSLVDDPGLSRNNTISKLSSLGSDRDQERLRDSLKCVSADRNFCDLLAQMQAIHTKHPLHAHGNLNETMRDDVVR